MTQTTKDILLATEGNGLNQKLENLVYQVHIKEKELDERLQQKEQYLEQLQQQIKEKQHLLRGTWNIETEMHGKVKTRTINRFFIVIFE